MSQPTAPRVLRIATRQSPLALWQAEHVAAELNGLGVKTEIIPLVSGGDTDMRPIDGSRQVGVFTKRIQQALLDDEADVAVHSLKDLPTEVDERLSLAAVPARETVQDALVSPQGWTLEQLPAGATIGTGSRRRAAQLKSRRQDLNIQPIRGNVQTRLEKLQSGQFDAILLAEAGLLRLAMHDLVRQRLSLEDMLPAPGQGALALEVRAGDQDAFAAVSGLNDSHARTGVTAERTLLAALHGGCLAPIAALGQVRDDQLTLQAVVLSSNGDQRLDEQGSTPLDPDNWADPAVDLANQLSESLIRRGARELIQAAR